MSNEKSFELKVLKNLKSWREVLGISSCYNSTAREKEIEKENALTGHEPKKNELQQDAPKSEPSGRLSPDTIQKVLLAKRIFNGTIIDVSNFPKQSCRRCCKPLDIRWNKPLLCADCYSNLLPSKDKDKKVLEEIERKTAIWKAEMKMKTRQVRRLRRRR